MIIEGLTRPMRARVIERSECTRVPFGRQQGPGDNDFAQRNFPGALTRATASPHRPARSSRPSWFFAFFVSMLLILAVVRGL